MARNTVVILSIFGILFTLNVQSTSTPAPGTKEFLETLYKDRSGFGIPSQETQLISSVGGDATYGEITYDSVEQLIKKLSPTKKDIFYDLGSGVGKLTIQFYLNSPVKKSIGIELSKTRFTQAQAVRDELHAAHKLSRGRSLTFRNEDIVKTNLSDATIIFMCSTCFSDELLGKLSQKFSRLKDGLRVLTLRELPHAQEYHLHLADTFNLPMTWSENSPVYLYMLAKN